ncbi:MAG: hypothetical protein ACK53L_05910, partial [Pirellulaceae bacterium]
MTWFSIAFTYNAAQVRSFSQLPDIVSLPRMTAENSQATPESENLGVYQAARLAKLRKIEARGLDPWGFRWDHRTLNRDLRAMAGQVQYRTAAGEVIDLPQLEGEGAVDYKAWK